MESYDDLTTSCWIKSSAILGTSLRLSESSRGIHGAKFFQVLPRRFVSVWSDPSQMLRAAVCYPSRVIIAALPVLCSKKQFIPSKHTIETNCDEDGV